MIVQDIYADAADVLATSDQATIFRRLTGAVKVLAQKADWDPLIGFTDICSGTDQRTVTLPPDVETPLAVNIGGQTAYMRNKWAEFHVNGMGSGSETSWTWDDQGFVPCFQDLMSPSRLVAVAQLQGDLGTPVRVFGLDELGRPVRTQAPDGSWQDGAAIQVNVMRDFPNGIITPTDQRYFYRLFSKTPTTELFAPNHGFVTGAEVILSLVTAPMPIPLIAGVSYFVGVVDANNIQLFATLQGALTDINPIIFTSASGSSIVALNDQRQIQVRTKFTSATPLNFQQGQQVTFSASTLPSPITPGEIFYLNLIDANNFTIHATADDANAGANPLFVNSAGAEVVAQGIQPATPYTQFDFSVNHDFLQGDAVMVANAGGTLPSPLLPSTNYYVRYLTNRSITLHATLADATNGVNPIILTDKGVGVTSIVKLIQASAAPGSVNNIIAQNHNLSGGDFVEFQSSGTLPSPLQQNVVYVAGPPSSTNSFTLSTTSSQTVATATRRRAANIAVITTATAHGLLSGDVVNIQSMGDSSYNATQVTVTVLSTTAFSYPNIGSNEGTFVTASRCRTNSIAVVETVTAHGLTTGTFVYIEGLGGSFSYNGWVQVTVIDSTHFYYTNTGGNEGGAPSSTRARSSNVATLVTGLPHGFSTGQHANIQGVGGGYDAFGVTVTVVDAQTFTYANTGGNEGTTAATAGYCAVGVSDPNGLVAAAVNDTGGIVIYGQINITDTGTGVLFLVISRAFTIGFTNGWFTDTSNLTTGTAIQLTTDGSLPASVPQVTPSVNYYVRVADAFTAYLYTSLAKANDSQARISVSRSRTGDVATLITAAAHGFSTGDYVDVSGLGGSGYNGLGNQVTVVDSTTFTYVNTGTNEATTADTGGLIVFSAIQITALGSGNIFFALDVPVTVGFLTNGMDIDNALYFTNGTPITLTTTGTLPAPLQPGNSYLASLDANGLLTFTLTDGTPITLTSIGSGNHFLNHINNFSVNLPSSIQVASNEYQNGDAVTFNTDGTAPTPLVKGTTYYVRRIDANSIELYDTMAHALDLPNTAGVVTLLDAGNGDQRLEQFLAPFLFLRITRVQLAMRKGAIDLWGWDYNRRADLTLVGTYQANETDPQYRRIKTLHAGCWIRMRYKRRTFQITSLQDYIPLAQGDALIMMLKSIDLYKNNFYDDGQRFETLAVQWTKEDHNSKRGPDSFAIQFNGPAMGICDDDHMT